MTRRGDDRTGRSLIVPLASLQTEPCRFLRHVQHIRFRQFGGRPHLFAFAAARVAPAVPASRRCSVCSPWHAV